MRLLRFLVIFLALSLMFAACGASDEDETDTEGGNSQDNSTADNSGSDDGNGSGDGQQNPNCGNKMVDDGEVCDGGAQECKSIDPNYTGGFASCKADCTGWDTSACQGNGSSSDPNDPGNNNDPTNPGGNGDGGFDKDSQGIWVDPKPFREGVHLVWENPMGNKGTGGLGPTHAASQTYCENLILAGADDWRLPTIDELRTLVRGISTIEPGGKCPTTDTCTKQETCNDDKENTQGFGNSCLGCEALNTDKYDPADSYLDLEKDCQLSSTQLANNECYIVKAMHGDPCDGTWSDTPNTGTAGSLSKAYWYLNYKSGIIHSDADVLSGANWVRCVREGTAADVTEEEEEAGDPSQNWECTADIDCTGGKTCQSHQCVAETYVATNGLEWQNGTINETLNKWEEGVIRVEKWEPAKAYCENLDYAGHTDWRLPNISELKTLVTGCAKTNECAITADCAEYTSCHGDSTACKNGCSNGNYLSIGVSQQIDFPYWTSNNDPTKTNRVWAINFMTGVVFYSYDTANHYARCVRGSMN
ncbi:DUF1566 domain-containing protein [bacterium]|nr:DUF1566 domain-containing protein [bacterium]